MIKTVAELIEQLRLMPQEAEPLMEYGAVIGIEDLELIGHTVYLRKEEVQVDDEEMNYPPLTEEQLEKIKQDWKAQKIDRLVKINQVIPGMATMDVPKD